MHEDIPVGTRVTGCLVFGEQSFVRRITVGYVFLLDICFETAKLFGKYSTCSYLDEIPHIHVPVRCGAHSACVYDQYATLCEFLSSSKGTMPWHDCLAGPVRKNAEILGHSLLVWKALRLSSPFVYFSFSFLVRDSCGAIRLRKTGLCTRRHC